VPANLTPQYKEAEERFKQASTQEDKIEALEEMLRLIPKHKGTEKMQADIKKRLAKQRKRAPAKKGTTQHPFYFVEREGIGQALLCGPPNSGKSLLLDLLTHATPEVAPYPFTTRVPLAGMMPFEDVQIQLVDMPPLSPDTFEAWMTLMIQQCDIAVLVFDVNDPDILDQTEFVLDRLAERDIDLSRPGDKPKLLVLGSKLDDPDAEQNLEVWQELYEARFKAQPFSAKSEDNLQWLKAELFRLLDVVRVYTKRPGKALEKDSAPFVLKRGSTVLDAARAVHKDLADSFKYARIWGDTRYEGQMVERTHPVEDGDLIEVHT
jgi:ribosome-interacting GTPase 1